MKSEGQLEITTVVGCQVACKHCPQEALVKRYRGPSTTRRLSLDDFRRVLASVPGSVRIVFAGMAEPWLNPDCTDMVLHAVEKGHPIAVFTTLVGMSLDDFERIKHLSFEEFVVHAADAQNNARIPVTDDYLRLLEAVIKTFCGEQRRPWFRVHSHGPIEPRVRELIHAAGYPRELPLEVHLINRAGNLPSDELNLPETEFIYGPIECRRCGTDTNHNVLLPDGRVVLCCMDYGLRHVLGNLLAEDYHDLQAGPVATAIRTAWDSHDADLLCRHCHDARPRYGAQGFSFESHLSEATLLEGDNTQLALWSVTIGAQDDERCIYLHPPAQLRFEVPTSEPGLFTSAVAIHPDAWDKPNAGGCEFSLLVDGHDVFRKVINPTLSAADRCWHEVSVSVPPNASGHHEFVLATHAVGSPPESRWALWRRPVFHWQLFEGQSDDRPGNNGHPSPLETAIDRQEVMEFETASSPGSTT